jgi:hypothetical protein
MAYTTNWLPVTPRIGLQPIATVSTTQNHPLGTVIKAYDAGANANGEGEFIYVKGVTNCAVGSWVLIAEDGYTTTLLVADDIGKVGIAMSAIDASTDYGWVQVAGKAVGKALSAFADNGNVYSTATAGSVDDAVVAGDRVKCCKGASALDGPATGMAEFEMDHPYVDDGLSA